MGSWANSRRFLWGQCSSLLVVLRGFRVLVIRIRLSPACTIRVLGVTGPSFIPEPWCVSLRFVTGSRVFMGFRGFVLSQTVRSLGCG